MRRTTSRTLLVLAAAMAAGGTACTPPTTTPAAPTSAMAWGYDGFGCLGDDAAAADRDAPVDVALPAGAHPSVVSAGAFHSLALAGSTLYAWGRGDSGQLGDGTTPLAQTTPVVVTAPAGVRFESISAGGTHNLAIGSNGVTYAWGDDTEGQLGDDAAFANRSTPVPVAAPPGVRFTAVSAGYAHSLAIGTDGVTYAWGYDGFGELGNGISGIDTPTPAPVLTPPGVHFVAVAAGGHHNLAIGDDGVTYAWGWDAYGQLGDDPAIADHLTPVAVDAPPGVRFARVVAGEHHSMALTSGGVAYAWGQDSEGQVGNDAALVDVTTPALVALPAGVTLRSIAGGGFHTVGVGKDGTAYAWGYDDEGEQGDGPPTVRHPVPAALTGGTDVKFRSVATGYYHVLAVVTGR